jgi:thiol-disulfide isomerase/thioredoxin
MAQTKSGCGGLGIFGTLLSVGLLVALFVYFAQSTAGGSGGSQLAPASVLAPVTSVSRPVLGAVATGGLADPFHVTPADTAILTGAGGKPEVLFMGAEFCPYCAAERWSIIVALSRFGTFTSLHLVRSSHLDVFPDTPSFTFYGSMYSGPYVDFVAVEERSNQPDANGYKPLQTPTTEQQHIYDTYGRPPYAQQSGIPFLDVGNRYIAVSSGYSPQVLQGQSWQAIADALSDPSAPTTRAIVGNANYITAAVCRVTGGAPASVCNGPMISRLAASMP